jgi:hypothetical protein
MPVTDSAEPLDLEEVKEWLLVDSDDDNSLLTRLITTCRQFIEKQTGRKLVPHLVVQRTCLTEEGILPLFYGEVSDVTGDMDNVALSRLDALGSATVLVRGEDYYLDSTQLYVLTPGDYKVTYKVGMNPSEDLLEAVKLMIAFRYSNRGDSAAKDQVPEEVVQIIEQNRVPCL